MGHRFSKSGTTTTASSNGTKTAAIKGTTNTNLSASEQRNNSNHISIPPSSVAATGGRTINLQIQEESPTTFRTGSIRLNNNGVGTNCPRQIIIKIQLAKMENGNEQQQQTDGVITDTIDANSNSLEVGGGNSDAQILNVTLNRNFTVTAGSPNATSSGINNNSFSRSTALDTHAYNALMGRINALHLNDELFEQSTNESAEYCEVLEDTDALSSLNQRDEPLEEQERLCSEEADTDNNCSHRKSSKSYSKQWRCCKCTYRDVIRRILEPSTKSKERKEQQKQQQHSNNNSRNSVIDQLRRPPPPLPQRHSMPVSSSSFAAPSSLGGVSNQQQQQQFSVWAHSTGSNGSADVIIPISSPQQFVVVQCPPTSLLTLGRINDNAIRLTATEIVGGGNTITSTTAAIQSQQSAAAGALVKATPNGPIVHSQVDFVHCLVPDLDCITAASYYWGKMDRYEAERLLDGKPEGTFLLRDSAQEEFLFSVTFRKYGRSLHARIEQSEHKFSFDCHDPCVFMAPSVCKLVEHYKDPLSVMFFEPMLTIPLHRKLTFSLQELCRAKIVSHTTYDGITELDLPPGMKGYLKEYHYKQKLRVKPFDEPFYKCT